MWSSTTADGALLGHTMTKCKDQGMPLWVHTSLIGRELEPVTTRCLHHPCLIPVANTRCEPLAMAKQDISRRNSRFQHRAPALSSCGLDRAGTRHLQHHN